MGVVWQKWAWFGKSERGHPKFFRALRAHTLLKEPPFLNSWIRPCTSFYLHVLLVQIAQAFNKDLFYLLEVLPNTFCFTAITA